MWRTAPEVEITTLERVVAECEKELERLQDVKSGHSKTSGRASGLQMSINNQQPGYCVVETNADGNIVNDGTGVFVRRAGWNPRDKGFMISVSSVKYRTSRSEGSVLVPGRVYIAGAKYFGVLCEYSMEAQVHWTTTLNPSVGVEDAPASEPRG